MPRRAEVGERPKFEDHLSSDVMPVLDDFQKLEIVAEWCADQCAQQGPELGSCVRTCLDVADIVRDTVQVLDRVIESLWGKSRRPGRRG